MNPEEIVHNENPDEINFDEEIQEQVQQDIKTESVANKTWKVIEDKADDRDYDDFMNYSSDSETSSKIDISDDDIEDNGVIEEVEDYYSGPLKSKNEIDLSVSDKAIFDLPLPDKLDEQVKIHKLGLISNIIGPNTIIVEASEKIEVNKVHVALDSETIIVLEDRKVIGRIHETFGPVQRPLYLIKFNQNDNLEDIENKYPIGIQVFYSEKEVRMVKVPELLKQKGNDASNMHDEEVSDIEDFSDDEQERLYNLKRKKEKQSKVSEESKSQNTKINKNQRGNSRKVNDYVNFDDPNNNDNDKSGRKVVSYDDLLNDFLGE